ncbi:MAG: tyrosine-protein phosphatase [Lentisphaerae bacterium]|nr:tyrosine-protein phosphatase [Lentisphaerota bacterium]
MTRIALLSPAAGATTPPLQTYAWTGFRTHARDPHIIRHAASGTNTFDRSLPHPVRLLWHDDAPRDTCYRVIVGRRPDLATPDVDILCTGRERCIYHLHVDTDYAWQVSRAAATPPVTSPIQSFHTHARGPRWIHAPGITNLRDLGGWLLTGGARLRQGLVYRASEMNGHLQLHPAGRRVLEDELGIRTDLDLRGEGEEARPVLDSRRVRWINEPIRPYGEIIRDIHFPGYRRIIELFADRANYPVLFHCWGGADRAGTVAYLLHALCGGDAEHLALDYELTSMAVWDERLRTNSGYRALLATLAMFGGRGASPRTQVEHYLHGVGVTRATLAAIRDILIEPAGPRGACAP